MPKSVPRLLVDKVRINMGLCLYITVCSVRKFKGVLKVFFLTLILMPDKFHESSNEFEKGLNGSGTVVSSIRVKANISFRLASKLHHFV